MAMALPTTVSIEGLRDGVFHHCSSTRTGFLKAIPLTLGELGVWNVSLYDREDRPWTLRPEVWTSTGSPGPSDTWSTVTPIVLDRYPKGREPGASSQPGRTDHCRVLRSDLVIQPSLERQGRESRCDPLAALRRGTACARFPATLLWPERREAVPYSCVDRFFRADRWTGPYWGRPLPWLWVMPSLA